MEIRTMKNAGVSAVLSSVVLVLTCVFTMSCSSTDQAVRGGSGQKLLCTYQQGASETVRFKTTSLYRNWVEMADSDDREQEVRHVVSREVVMRRYVESVASDGSAVIKVTLEEVKVSTGTERAGKVTEKEYTSNQEGTISSIFGAPELVGSVYRVRVAPDTKVLEIMGLGELIKKAGITKGVKGMYGSVLKDRFIRQCHQRSAMMQGLSAGSRRKTVVPVPNVFGMIKAEAVKITYKASGVISKDGKNTVEITFNGESMLTRPEGVPEPPEHSDFWMALIKDKSDMEEFSMSGRTIFDVTAGRVQSENSTVEAELVLLSENAFPSANASTSEGASDVMITELQLKNEFEVVQ